jgi:cysteine synthase B
VGAGTDQSIALAKAISKPRPDVYYMPNQYDNEANFMAHYESTGPEIWKQMDGRLTHFFTGCGTGGTITGTATYLKEQNRNVKVIAVQAQKNHLLQGLRNFEESAMPDLFIRRQQVVDAWFTATNDESFHMVKELASRENLLVGPSSGAVMASMLNVADKFDSGIMIGIFADDGRKFKSLYAEHGVFNLTEYERLLRANTYLPETACPYSRN